MCSCDTVTVAEISDAIEAGAETLDELLEMVGVSTKCEPCREHVERLLD